LHVAHRAVRAKAPERLVEARDLGIQEVVEERLSVSASTFVLLVTELGPGLTVLVRDVEPVVEEPPAPAPDRLRQTLGLAAGREVAVVPLRALREPLRERVESRAHPADLLCAEGRCHLRPTLATERDQRGRQRAIQRAGRERRDAG